MFIFNQKKTNACVLITGLRLCNNDCDLLVTPVLSIIEHCKSVCGADSRIDSNNPELRASFFTSKMSFAFL